MSSITKISPLAATRGATGTLITVTGTGFGASQGYGTVEIGGVEAIIASWADTSITCRADDDPATPLGAQDVVVTPNGGTGITDIDGIIIYDATDNKDDTEVEFLQVEDVYVDGLHVGYTGPDGLNIEQQAQDFEFIPDDAFVPAVHRSYVTGETVTVGFAQLFHNGALLASILGGTYDTGTKVVSVSGAALRAEHSLMLIDKAGIIHVWARVKPTGNISLSVNKSFGNIPVSFRAFAKATEELHKIDLTAALA